MRRVYKILLLGLITLTFLSYIFLYSQTKIFLARHGQTDWNREGRIQGWTDTELNELGKKQAQALYNYLKRENIKVIYTSTLKRTIQTAKPFTKKTSIPIQNIKELREMNMGILQGHLNSEPEVRKELNLMKKNLNYRVPKGESYMDFYKRVSKFMEKILKKHKNETILIIGHNGTNSMILAYLLNISLEKAIKIYQPNNLVFTIFLLPGQKSPTVVWKYLR
ncbi:histidine phosphatase family protein [Candidatus Aminicenantes bacterium AC-708-M15]|jgi:probable phosphoglycerate mutase|nr:histidine phosphatase family protein [SCandidatus Aminicenantes bacterium Aminicenantia_JdfR_composite]MCP2604250.1 histidine phosphatase family protein [Candidatus Aminicenantes bacterium AC-708-M15]MCP2618155.1 histidine phosphatase family protein [Candidatus Aminicenantes bacterium AC-335-A11]